MSVPVDLEGHKVSALSVGLKIVYSTGRSVLIVKTLRAGELK